ncbi:MAG: hypothetical protein KGJ35_00725 [Patescibacteria group bacterium]|nr:hypothetical protein [Patescibacteria group bacterium]
MEQFPHQKTVEKEANFEGDHCLLLLERLNDPIIKRQLIDMLYQNECVEAERIQKHIFTPFVLPNQPNLKCFKDEEGVIYTSSDPEYEPKNYRAKSKEEIENDLTERINLAATETPIDFSANEPDEGCIPLNWKMPWTKEKPSARQMNIILSHEKGHIIRKYGDLRDYFSKGFDTTKIEYSDADFEMDKMAHRKDDSDDEFGEELDKEQMKQKTILYLMSGNEIAERMSQLKNYFGLKGSERFTVEHLLYARKNYIADTGIDNRMKHFFQAITSETESTFIELINSSGI